MAINIESALRTGFSRTVARNGLLLAVLLFVVSAVNAIVGLGIARWVSARDILPVNAPFPPEVGAAIFAVPPVLGGFVSLALGIVTIVLTIGAIRTFVSDETERLPSAYFTENMVIPGLNFFVGTIVFAIVVAIGLVFLVVPGIFLLVTLAFWAVFVAVDDRNFIEGMQKSWALTRGSRFQLFLLGLAVVLINILVSVVFGIGGLTGGLAEVLVTEFTGAVTTIFSLATLAAAYNQLTAGGSPENTVQAEESGHAPA